MKFDNPDSRMFTKTHENAFTKIHEIEKYREYESEENIQKVIKVKYIGRTGLSDLVFDARLMIFFI